MIENLSNMEKSETKPAYQIITMSEASDRIKPDDSKPIGNRKNSDVDSGNDSDGFNESPPGSPEIVEAMSKCNIGENDLPEKEKSISKILKSEIKIKKPEQTTKVIKSEPLNEPKGIKLHNDGLKVNGDMLTLQVRIKKSKSTKDKNEEKPRKSSDHNNVSTSKIDDLLESFSKVNLSKNVEESKKNRKDVKIKIISENCQYKEPSKNAINKELSERKSKDDKRKEKKIFLIERGPMRNSDTKIKYPPYEKQVHRKALSGGKVVVKSVDPEIDMIPSTIEFEEIQQNILIKKTHNETHLDVCNELNRMIENMSELGSQNPNDFYSWEEDLNILMEVLEGDQRPHHKSKEKQNSSEMNRECEEIIKKFLVEDSSNTPSVEVIPCGASDYDEGKLTCNNNPFVSSPPLTIQMSPNYNGMDKNLLVPSDINSIPTYHSNLSPYSHSPMQCLRSPSIDNVDNAAFSENALLYESPINSSSIPSVSAESHGSFSSLNSSPNFQQRDDIFTFIEKSYCSNNPSSVHSEPPTIPVEFGSSISSFSPASDSIVDYHQYNSPDYPYREHQQTLIVQNNNAEPQYGAFEDLLCSNAQISPAQKSRSKLETTQVRSVLNTLRTKFLPIAPREVRPCCTDYKTPAKQVLEGMFNRLEEKTKKTICLKIHGSSEDRLLELFDGQLSSWNDNLGSQFPHLPLLHATCERLLMRSTTMIKFFEVYVNGHTILDRALFQCSQTPLVIKYLAECMLRARPHLALNDNSPIDKSDMTGNTVLHRAAGRGDQCAMSLAALLSLNEYTSAPIFNVNKVNSEGYTPLHIACSRHIPISSGNCSCFQTVHILLEHGHADPNIKDRRSGNTPLHVAVDTSSCAVNLVALLIKNGAKLIKNYKGATPLDLAKAANRSSSQSHSTKQVVDMLKKIK